MLYLITPDGIVSTTEASLGEALVDAQRGRPLAQQPWQTQPSVAGGVSPEKVLALALRHGLDARVGLVVHGGFIDQALEPDRLRAAERNQNRIAAQLQSIAAEPRHADRDWPRRQRAIAAEARQRGLDVTYPRCARSGPAMTLHDVEKPDQLKAGGRYGLREPVAGCRAVTLQEVDVVLLPGLGWDRFGGRLGRGAGFYDRLLAEPGWGGFRCGLFFAAQEFPRIPVDPWDVPLHAVVTEEEVWRLSAGEGSASPGS